ncbi:hypothetical protein GCM10025794_32940 [Massilia kyonggiensis]
MEKDGDSKEHNEACNQQNSSQAIDKQWHSQERLREARWELAAEVRMA